MSAWRVFARSTRSTWRGPTLTSPPSPTTSVSSLISSIRLVGFCVIEDWIEVWLAFTPAMSFQSRDIGKVVRTLILVHCQSMKSSNYRTQLADLSCLVYQKSTNTYAPYNKVTINFHSSARSIEIGFVGGPAQSDLILFSIMDCISYFDMIIILSSRIGFDSFFLSSRIGSRRRSTSCCGGRPSRQTRASLLDLPPI